MDGESASSRDRAETRWNGWAITLPGEPCLTLFRCPLSSCSRPPVCVHPDLLDPPASISPERTAVIQPSLDYNRALASRSAVQFHLVLPRLTPSGDPRPNRSGAWARWIINRVPLGGQSWVTSVYPSMGTTLRIFALVRSATNAILTCHIWKYCEYLKD